MSLIRQGKKVFDEALPGERWHIVSGLLLGVLRTGAPIPWDSDADFGVNRKTFNTEETLRKLDNHFGSKKLLTSTFQECGDQLFRGGEATRTPWAGGCPIYSLDDDTVLVVHREPAAYEVMGKIVDRKTGIYIDLSDEFPCASEIEETVISGGLSLPVPKFPITEGALWEEYHSDLSINLKRMKTSELFECKCHNKKLQETSAPLENLNDMVAMQPCSDAKAQWVLAKVDELANVGKANHLSCCKLIDGDFREKIEMRPRWGPTTMPTVGTGNKQSHRLLAVLVVSGGCVIIIILACWMHSRFAGKTGTLVPSLWASTPEL